MKKHILMTGILFLIIISGVQAEEKEKIFSPQLRLEINEIAPRQPFKAILEWKNISKKIQQLSIPSEGIFIYLAFEANEFKPYRLFYPAQEEVHEGINPEWDIHGLLAAGKTYRATRWIALARADAQTQWEFLFEKSGKYRIALDPEGKDAVRLTVKEVTLKEDKEALKHFSTEAAELFLGDNFAVKSAEPKLNTIMAKYPQSLYAGYAAYALANYQWKQDGGFALDFPLFSKRLNFIIEQQAQNPQILEEALYLMGKGLAFQKEGRREAKKYFSLLQERFPQSPYIEELKKSYGIGVEVAPKISFPVPLSYCEDFQFKGLENVALPELRNILENYLKDKASKDYLKPLDLLAKDFMGDDGDKNSRREILQGIEPAVNILKMEVMIKSSQPVKEYQRPATLPKGLAKNWRGDLVVIKGKLNLWLEDRITGNKIPQKDITAEWVFRKESGKWVLLSEVLASR